jgi:glycosyltransferase involved in cell wall biosynthesis
VPAPTIASQSRATESRLPDLKVVVVHNRYQQAGGEDQVFLAESRLLAAHGDHVRVFTVDNRDLDSTRPVRLAAMTVWNSNAYWKLRALFRQEQPHIVHFHNTFPMISPAGYYAARAEGVAVVQTLHNFRLMCPNALFYRAGRVCEDCMGRSVPWPAVVHSCYRGSRAATIATAVMLSVHRAARTWSTLVNRYIALSEFARRKFMEGGIPAERLVVKPNFIHRDPGVGAHDGGFALFAGRLSPEKGLEVLLSACAKLGGSLPLKIIGAGPLAGASREGTGPVEWLGAVTEERVLTLMQQASFLVFPSQVYENFPITLVQAFATGLPVIASGHGSIGEIVSDGVTGCHVRPGDSNDLAEKLEWAITHRDALARMGSRAREEFENRYTAERNYQQLLEVYRVAARGLTRAA